MYRIASAIVIFLTALVILSCADPVQKTNVQPIAELQDIPRACIKRVIAVDDSIGTIRNHACEKISLSQTILDYVNGMEAIDYKNCPTIFTTAFARHRKAWVDMVVITDKYPGLRGEMHDLFKELKTSVDSVNFEIKEKAIWDTWAQVEKAMK